MYKNYTKIWCARGGHTPKLFLIMKLTILLLMTALIQVNAASFGQRLTLKASNIPVGKVFVEISNQTGYDVLLSTTNFNINKRIDVNYHDTEVETVIKNLLSKSGLAYTIEDKTIVIREKTPGYLDRLTSLFAEIDVRGRVLDSLGTPLQGATIKISGTNRRVFTDNQGRFNITSISEEAILTISFVGYKDKEVKAARELGDIILEMSANQLTELVVSTGYTQRKASELTGGVQSIGGEQLRNGVSTLNAAAMLKGVATGLYIVEQGGSVATRGQVVMRGQSSFNDNSNPNFGPLIVVDGVITNAANLQDIVDPQDIESINILRDAASTAVFGSRAAQGVMVVTTKRGRLGKLNINFGSNYGKVQNNRAIRFMNTEEATAHITKSMESLYNGTASLRSLYPTFEQYYNTTRTFTDAEKSVNTGWDNAAFFSDGAQSDMNLSISSGTEQTKFYAGLKWSKQDGTILDDNVDRKSARINIDQKITDKLSFSVNTNALLDRYTATTSENQYYILQPWVSPYYSSGGLADSIPNYSYRASGSRITQYYDNPLFSHSYNSAITKRLNLLGTGVLKYDLLPWLSVQSSNTINYTGNDLNSYRDPRTYRGRADGPASNRVYINGSLILNGTKSTYLLSSNLININKIIGNHQLKGIIGQEYSKTHMESFSVSMYNTPYPGERNMNAFFAYGTYSNKQFNRPAIPFTTDPIDRASFSLFSELSDIFKSKYLASASVRRDASTNFGRNNRYGTFYSLSAGWLLHKEDFLSNIKALSNLKLRASYGTSGREAGMDFLNFSTYNDQVFYNTNTTAGSTISRLGNDNITWETTYTTNLGIDLGLFSRINLSLDVYNKDSKNLLQVVSLPSYVGFGTQTRNVGELNNKGLDIMLSSANIQSKDFEWNMSFNVSFNKNKIVSLQGDSIIDGWSRSYYRYIGEDINTMRAIKYVGVNPDNGRPLFERVLGDGSIQIVDSIPLAKVGGLRSYQDVGSATPKFFGGFTNSFRYKNFNLSVLMNFSYGNKVFNNPLRNFMNPTLWQSGFNIVQPDENIRFWQGPGDTKANYPDFYDVAYAQRGGTNLNSSLLYVDASYLRMRNIRLGYDLSKTMLSKIRLSALNVYVSADNVFVIKSKDLFAADPEGSLIGTESNSFGGSGLASAMPRRFLIGLTAGF